MKQTGFEFQGSSPTTVTLLLAPSGSRVATNMGACCWLEYGALVSISKNKHNPQPRNQNPKQIYIIQMKFNYQEAFIQHGNLSNGEQLQAAFEFQMEK